LAGAETAADEVVRQVGEEGHDGLGPGRRDEIPSRSRALPPWSVPGFTGWTGNSAPQRIRTS